MASMRIVISSLYSDHYDSHCALMRMHHRSPAAPRFRFPASRAHPSTLMAAFSRLPVTASSRVARVLQWTAMSRRITQRELRNESGRIMRALDKGKSFIVTRNGVPVGELIPLRQRVFVSADAAQAAFVGAPRVALGRFRQDVDVVIDQDSTPRA
jgi:antitoxin (DNA-binding transcriptional repressor) of toxin-antitoxin stability system